jgi:hypothetical protein
MMNKPHPLAPKRPLEGTAFQFEFMTVDELNNDFYKSYMEEEARKALLRNAIERKISSLTIKNNACDSKQDAKG